MAEHPTEAIREALQLNITTCHLDAVSGATLVQKSIHLNISSSQVPTENCQNSIKLESDMFFEAGTYSLAKPSAAWSLEELLSTCPTLVSQNLQSCRMLRECFESCKNHVGLPVFPCFLPHYVYTFSTTTVFHHDGYCRTSTSMEANHSF